MTCSMIVPTRVECLDETTVTLFLDRRLPAGRASSVEGRKSRGSSGSRPSTFDPRQKHSPRSSRLSLVARLRAVKLLLTDVDGVIWLGAQTETQKFVAIILRKNGAALCIQREWIDLLLFVSDRLSRRNVDKDTLDR